MGTRNFAYENRCIVVSNDDYECGYCPSIKEDSCDYDRNYPSQELSISDDFIFWNIVITSGYYSDACIDYIEDENKDVEYFVGASHYYSTKKEFYNEVQHAFGGQFPLSIYRLDKICGKVNGDFETWLENAYDKIREYMMDIEEIRVNKCLDQLKNAYGFEEIVCVGGFSDGTGVYKKVS